MFAHFFAGLIVVAAAIPDVVTPGTRGIRVALTIESQALRDDCCVQHIVAKGDTLSIIAANHRKDLLAKDRDSTDRDLATTVDDIVALNAGLEPSKLTVGQRIWMPPRNPDAAKTENTFVFIAQGWRLHGFGKPFAPAAKIVAPARCETMFMLVPASELAAYTKITKSGNYNALSKWKETGKFQSLMTVGSSVRVWNESPVFTCQDTITIERSDEGVLSAKLTSVAYDKGGKVVTASERNKDYRKDREMNWLLLLPFFGGGWLLWSMRRQREGIVVATA